MLPPQRLPLLPNVLHGVRREIEAACPAGKARSGFGDFGRHLEDFRRRCDRAGDRGRSAGVRREPRAGGQGEVAGVEGASSRHRASSRRRAAVEQGEGGGRAVRCDPFRGSAELAQALAKEIARQGRDADAAGRDQYRRRAAERPASCRSMPTLSCATVARATVSSIAGLMCIPPADEPRRRILPSPPRSRAATVLLCCRWA